MRYDIYYLLFTIYSYCTPGNEQGEPLIPGGEILGGLVPHFSESRLVSRCLTVSHGVSRCLTVSHGVSAKASHLTRVYVFYVCL
jgi:hypothetical protein